MLVIVVMMTYSIGSENGDEMIAGDVRGIVIGTVRGADVTGGDVTTADQHQVASALMEFWVVVDTHEYSTATSA